MTTWRGRAGLVLAFRIGIGIGAGAAAAGLGGLGCDDRSHRDIGDEINILIRRNDALVAPATERLARYGRQAVPQIETALHTAAPVGRMHLMAALGRIGDEAAVPVLRHFAVYDARLEVRQAAAALLARWAADGSAASRAERARAAEREVARKRAAGEGPVLAEGDIPGAPTVGAPEPVGVDLEKTRR